MIPSSEITATNLLPCYHWLNRINAKHCPQPTTCAPPAGEPFPGWAQRGQNLLDVAQIPGSRFKFSLIWLQSLPPCRCYNLVHAWLLRDWLRNSLLRNSGLRRSRFSTYIHLERPIKGRHKIAKNLLFIRRQGKDENRHKPLSPWNPGMDIQTDLESPIKDSRVFTVFF